MAEKPQMQPGFSRRGAGFGAPVEKPENTKQTLMRLLTYFRSELKFVILMSAAVVISVVASVLAPSFQSDAIDKIVSAQYGLLPKILALMLAMHVIHGAATLTQGYISASLSQRIVSRLRKELFGRIVRLPISYIDSHSHGDLISRMTNDADKAVFYQWHCACLHRCFFAGRGRFL